MRNLAQRWPGFVRCRCGTFNILCVCEDLNQRESNVFFFVPIFEINLLFSARNFRSLWNRKRLIAAWSVIRSAPSHCINKVRSMVMHWRLQQKTASKQKNGLPSSYTCVHPDIKSKLDDIFPLCWKANEPHSRRNSSIRTLLMTHIKVINNIFTVKMYLN